MENNQTNKRSHLERAKKQKTHLVTAVSILGVALVAVIIIAAVMTVMNGDRILSSDGRKLNGSTAGELHSAVKESVTANDNYTVTMLKSGIVDLSNGILTGNFSEEVVTCVDGDNFYYKSVSEKNYKYYDDVSPSKITVTREITVLDGVAYIRIKTEEVYANAMTPDPVESMTKCAAEKVEEYIESLDVFENILWENGGLFNEARFEKNSEGNYRVSSGASDSQLKETVYNDITLFFQEHAEWVTADKSTVYNDIEYAEVYDENSRLLSVSSGYKMKGVTVGTVQMNASLTYGDASIVLPENADLYIGSGT